MASTPSNPAQSDAQPIELETMIGYNLKRAYMVFQTDFLEALGDDTLTPRSFSVLTLIAQITNITQSEISRHLGIERSGLVSIVDQLQKAGLIQRTPVPGDRRVQALTMTETGIKSFDNYSKRTRNIVRITATHKTYIGLLNLKMALQ